MDIAQFRTEFPEFSDLARYPSSQIAFWATLAEAQTVLAKWGDVWATGVKLYVAHEITLSAQSAMAGRNGGVPGSQGGIANTKTVGSVTVGYDANTTTEKNAGWWNLTNYGKQYFRLAQMFGAGCIQL